MTKPGGKNSKSPLESFKILIADQDQQLAMVSKQMLLGMGFTNVHLTRSGAKGLELIEAGGFDFLITDWSLKDMDGMLLLNNIRRGTHSPNPTMPVIMLTGRMEQSDVHTARDNGIHEYVIKPFSARTIYSRLERIVEFPRYFIVTRDYVGPDRRHRQEPPSGGVDRRTQPVLPQRKPKDTAAAINSDSSPRLWLPDLALKHKLGHDVTLESIITPAVLNHAQAAINACAADSLQWVKDDLAVLTLLCTALKQDKRTEAIMAEMNEVALMISSRSGTFGYARASEVAYMLYMFCRKKFHPENPNHFIVIEQHIKVLQIIFGKNIFGEEEEIIQIIAELKHLTEKYAP